MSPITPAETIADSQQQQDAAQPPDSKEIDSKEPDPYHVRLEGDENPKSMPKFKKWMAIVIICSAATCVTCASSVVSFFPLLRVFILRRPAGIQCRASDSHFALPSGRPSRTGFVYAKAYARAMARLSTHYDPRHFSVRRGPGNRPSAPRTSLGVLRSELRVLVELCALLGVEFTCGSSA